MLKAPTITCGQTTFIRIEGWTSERIASSRDASLADALYPNAHSLGKYESKLAPREAWILYSTRCIPDSSLCPSNFGFWIPIVNGLLWDSGFVELYSGFQTLGFRIPQAKFSRIPDSISKKVPDSRMEIPLHEVSKRSISTKLRENRELYSSRETMDSVSPGSVIPGWEKNLDRWERKENYFAIFLSVWQVSAVHKQQTRDKTNFSPVALFCGCISG